MHHRLDLLVPQHRLKSGSVAKVAFDERPPAHSLAVARHQTVESYGGKALLGERLANMGAAITRTARDQYSFHTEILRRSNALSSPQQGGATPIPPQPDHSH